MHDLFKFFMKFITNELFTGRFIFYLLNFKVFKNFIYFVVTCRVIYLYFGYGEPLKNNAPEDNMYK